MFKKLISFLFVILVSSLLFTSVFASTTPRAEGAIVSPGRQFISDRYIPLRLVAESLGFSVIWNKDDKTIDIFTAGEKKGDSEHICRFSPEEYITSDGRSYIPASSILRLSSKGSCISFMGNEGYYIYRDWLSLSESKGLVLEQSFERSLDDDVCEVKLYSDGNKEHPGGPPTVRIRVYIWSRIF
ncbi:MAG: stalk domain-containing protein [Candidatus Colwellbacteria bacterium]|nr:copper amine oxidase N-terminal domain-containing protein [Candidatus Colwellbacteria bacterium]MCK9497729.1 copper amine oxidase N-terminal domain-containing protein [Candidatus Colwellbacteria bacterium]MDD3752646.1 stalk domain-containing protein [Candidatus Colwellbacteria bacterium]MDD4818960.1 stalk domain-containing protein [Candidatus Colwellbacteria bacterium]